MNRFKEYSVRSSRRLAALGGGLGFLLLWGGLGGAAEAQTITTIDDGAVLPSTNIALEYIPASMASFNENWQKSSGGVVDAGATFTTGASGFTLDTVTIQIVPVTGTLTGASFQMSLDTFASASATTPTSTLWTNSGTLPATITSGDYLTFNVPDTALSASTTYGFLLQFTSASSVQAGLELGVSAYTGGIALSYNGTSYSNYSSSHYVVFALQEVAVPEPPTAALLAVAATALLLLTYRQRKLAAG